MEFRGEETASNITIRDLRLFAYLVRLGLRFQNPLAFFSSCPTRAKFSTRAPSAGHELTSSRQLPPHAKKWKMEKNIIITCPPLRR